MSSQRTLIGCYITKASDSISEEKSGELEVFFEAASGIGNESEVVIKTMSRYILLQSKSPAKWRGALNSETGRVFPHLYLAQGQMTQVPFMVDEYFKQVSQALEECPIRSFLVIGDRDFCALSYQIIAHQLNGGDGNIHITDGDMLRYIMNTKLSHFHFRWRDTVTPSRAICCTLHELTRAIPSLPLLARQMNPVKMLNALGQPIAMH